MTNGFKVLIYLTLISFKSKSLRNNFLPWHHFTNAIYIPRKNIYVHTLYLALLPASHSDMQLCTCLPPYTAMMTFNPQSFNYSPILLHSLDIPFWIATVSKWYLNMYSFAIESKNMYAKHFKPKTHESDRLNNLNISSNIMYIYFSGKHGNLCSWRFL